MATTLTQAVHQNLECPVCLSFFKDPKILTCSHTFCKGCLETLLESLPGGQSISCPVCRGATPVPEGDVSKLPTSIALRSLVEDVETQGQLCANCDPQDKALAVAYCKECGEYLCTFCKTVHLKWLKFSQHSIVSVSDALSGEIPLKRRYKCQKHPSEDEECFCFTCNVYVCFRCGVLDHSHEGHKIAEATVHENKQKKSINELASKAEEKNDSANQFIACVAEEREKLQKVQKKLNDDIDEAYEDSVRKLTERREALKNEVGQQVTKLETMLASMEAKTRDQVSKVTSICELVKNGLRVPLQKEALTAHTTLCKELEQVLSSVEPDREQLLEHTREQGKRLGFERSKDLTGLEIGQVRRGKPKWVLHTEQQLAAKDCMNGIAASPYNTVSVGRSTGGICTYSADGHLQKTMMENVKIRRLHYFPNGCYAVRDTKNHVTLHSPKHQDRNVKFETLTTDQGGSGGLTVCKDSLVFIGYTEAKKIQVFKPEGGKAVREISCEGYKPWQIFAMTSGNTLLVTNYSNSVHVIDRVSGAIIHSISKDGNSVIPCLGKDDSVLVAWVKHNEGIVNIDLYTQELEFKKTLINTFEIMKPGRGWYCLQMFKSGEIAFCTPDRLYIFKEITE